MPVTAPRLSDHARLDVLLDERDRVMLDLAAACDVLWAFVQADGPDEHERAYRRARAFLLLTP